LRRTIGRTLQREFEHAGVAAMQAAKKVHRIAQVAGRARSAGFQENCEMRMAPAAVTLHPRKLRIRDIECGTVDRPAERHSYLTFPTTEGLCSVFSNQRP
jgi:hypothetical protein